MIGASMRIDGNVTFRGVLRIQGDIVGDIACDDDPKGTVVTDSSGRITGSIRSPCIVVKGKLSGPSHVAESVQVQQDGHIAGDLVYKEIEIRKGGIIEGRLTAGSAHDPQQYSPVERTLATADANAANVTNAIETTSDKGGKHLLVGAVLILVAGLVLFWMNPFSTEEKPSLAGFALTTDSSIKNSTIAQSAPAGSAQQNTQPQQDTDRTPATGADIREAKPAPQPDGSTPSEADAEKITIVQGVNPRKPDDFFWITAREPTVLLKKQRGEKTDGNRIDVSAGKKINIAIAKDEILRVEQGRNIEILFQGKKVGQKTIESGDWISFTPHSDHR